MSQLQEVISEVILIEEYYRKLDTILNGYKAIGGKSKDVSNKTFTYILKEITLNACIYSIVHLLFTNKIFHVSPRRMRSGDCGGQFFVLLRPV